MLWILRLVASTGLLGLVSQWPRTTGAAVALGLGVCVAGALLALAVVGVRVMRDSTTPPASGAPGHALPF